MKRSALGRWLAARRDVRAGEFLVHLLRVHSGVAQQRVAAQDAKPVITLVAHALERTSIEFHTLTMQRAKVRVDLTIAVVRVVVTWVLRRTTCR